jgi:hypothetical protein
LGLSMVKCGIDSMMAVAGKGEKQNFYDVYNCTNLGPAYDAAVAQANQILTDCMNDINDYCGPPCS